MNQIARFFLPSGPGLPVAREQGACPITPPRARLTDPDTSVEAGDRASPIAREHYKRISEALALYGQGTIYDIARWSSLTHVQVARRLPEMSSLYVVVEGAFGLSPANCKCRVWRAV